MKPQDCCVLIPSLSPDERLPAYVKELLAADFRLVLVVDDGSKEEYQHIFNEIAGWERCHVLHHEVNRGKGAALRTGYTYLKEETDIAGVITADSDGQHIVPDTVMLAEELGKAAFRCPPNPGWVIGLPRWCSACSTAIICPILRRGCGPSTGI